MIGYPSKGFDVLINVTDICDARCVMCNIWKNQLSGDSFLSPDLLRSVKPISSVSFAGGEPFLHEQIIDIVKVVHDNNPKAKIIFSSNGFQTEEIVAKMQEIMAIHPNLQVTISLDGVGTVHDRIRGIPGAWDKVNRTFDRLGEIGLRRKNFGFTITADNFASLPDVYAHAKKKGAMLSIGVAQDSKYLNVEVPHINMEKVFPYLNPIVDDLLRSWRPFDWARAFFLYGILRYIETDRRPIVCDALSNQFMIDQTGTVYSCHPIMLSAGSLKDKPLQDLLTGDKADGLRSQCEACHACWEVCTARSGMRGHLLRLGLWAGTNKLLAHLRLRGGNRGTMLFPATLKRAVPSTQESISPASE